MGLNTLSNNTTRRLDNTYYSVLEKFSVLHSNIMSMKELASEAKQLNEEFKTESERVIHEVEVQIDGFEDIEDQQKRIQGLQGRVQVGRERVKTLGERVEIVRDKVEGWEKAEGEWQEKTRRRLRILWIMMAVVAAFLVALMGFRMTPARSGADLLKGVNTSSLAEVLLDLERIGNQSLHWKTTGMHAFEKRLEKDEREKSEEDPRLRLFDDL